MNSINRDDEPSRGGRRVVGQRVKALRQKLELTQRELAIKAHVSPNTVRAYECATLETREEKRAAIASALGVTLALLEHDDQRMANDHPLLVGLNEEALHMAHAYVRASTSTRIQVQRLLGRDSG